MLAIAMQNALHKKLYLTDKHLAHQLTHTKTDCHIDKILLVVLLYTDFPLQNTNKLLTMIISVATITHNT